MTDNPNAQYEGNPSQPYHQSSGPVADPYAQASEVPAGEASAGYVDPHAQQQPYGNEMTQPLPQQQPYSAEHTGPIPTGGYPINAPQQTPDAKAGASLGAAITDLGFRRILAPEIAKVAFLLISIALLLGWLGSIGSQLMQIIEYGTHRSIGFSLWMSLFATLLTGWILPLAMILLLRIGLEWAVNSLKKLQQ